jgi:hypothetical protein
MMNIAILTLLKNASKMLVEIRNEGRTSPTFKKLKKQNKKKDKVIIK